MSYSRLLKLLILFSIFGLLACAHGEYSVYPLNFRVPAEAGQEGYVTGVTVASVEVTAEEGWKADRFIQKEQACSNLRHGVEEVLWSAGYEVVPTDSPDATVLHVAYRNAGSAAGCTGAWSRAYVDVRMLRQGEVIFVKSYYHANRGGSGFSACTKVVQRCLEDLHRDLSSPALKRKLKPTSEVLG